MTPAERSNNDATEPSPDVTQDDLRGAIAGAPVGVQRPVEVMQRHVDALYFVLTASRRGMAAETWRLLSAERRRMARGSMLERFGVPWYRRILPAAWRRDLR